MKNTVYIGMDVHKESFTLCCYTFEDDKIQYQQKILADYKLVLKYIARMRCYYGADTEFLCGYEAGCLGYPLYHQLMDHGVECVILAPSTMGVMNTKGIKTDRKDAENIAKCLAFHTYSAVYIPTEEDEEVKEYIRMRDDHKKSLKRIKQQILALLLRQGYKYTNGNNHWTIKHVKWIRTLPMTGLMKETLDEYLVTYEYLSAKIDMYDKRIEEIACNKRYKENVEKLRCFLGIKTYSAMTLLVETGDFRRFKKADRYSAYLGLVPREHSSGDNTNRYGITKAGNDHLRTLLVEAAQSYTKGKVGAKSKDLKRRQSGNHPQVIAYADKANERLRRKYYRMTLKNGTKRNVAVTAIARELSCFIWGMMTGAIQ